MALLGFSVANKSDKTQTPLQIWIFSVYSLVAIAQLNYWNCLSDHLYTADKVNRLKETWMSLPVSKVLLYAVC